MTWQPKWLISTLVAFWSLGCDPCWDKREDQEILQCVGRYPVENILTHKQVATHLSEHKVYISMTTSPKRISKIHWVLKSLDLTYVDEILLALPEKYKNKEDYDIPENLLKFPKLKILRRADDLGPIMKLLPAVEYVKSLGDEEATVITVDDDTAYPKGVIGQLLKERIKRNAVIAGCGHGSDHFGVQKYWPEEQTLFPALNVIEGYCGIAYPVKQVNVSRMIEVSKMGLKKVCFTSDDLVISWVLAESKVPRFRVRNQYHPGISQYQYGFERDALHQSAQCYSGNCSFFERYQDCARAILASRR